MVEIERTRNHPLDINDEIERIRGYLLETDQFKDWKNEPEKFRLFGIDDERKPCFDILLEKLSDRKITVTQYELRVNVIEQVNAMQDEVMLSGGDIGSSGPGGGYIRFTYKRLRKF